MKNIDFYLNVCNTFQSQINANIHRITPFHDIFLKHFSESSDIFINKSHTVITNLKILNNKKSDKEILRGKK